MPVAQNRRTAPMPVDDDKRKANVRLALVLASVALVLMLGFVAKIALFNG